MSHFIITRYNLSVYSDRSTRYKLGCDPDDWMQHRFELFSRFTLPSMQGQTCQNFTWFVFVDPATPREFKQQLEDAAIPTMKIVYLQEPQLTFLKREVQQASDDLVITSRIDNDDAWHKALVETIQTRFTRPTRLVDFPQSYWLVWPSKQLYLRPWRWYYHLKRGVSNMPTLVEYRHQAMTIQIDRHPKLKDYVRWYQFKQVVRGCYRLIVCHKKNQVNTIDVGSPKFKRIPLDRLRDFNVVID